MKKNEIKCLDGAEWRETDRTRGKKINLPENLDYSSLK